MTARQTKKEADPNRAPPRPRPMLLVVLLLIDREPPMTQI